MLRPGDASRASAASASAVAIGAVADHSRPSPVSHSLASLADGPKHWHAMIEDISTLCGTRLGPGTLYGAIKRLEAEGLIGTLPPEERRRPCRSCRQPREVWSPAAQDRRRRDRPHLATTHAFPGVRDWWFAFKWMQKTPRLALGVLGIQVTLTLVAMARVYILGL